MVERRTGADAAARRRRRVGGLAATALLGAVALGGAAWPGEAATPTAGAPAGPTAATADLTLADAAVRHLNDLDLLVFEVAVAGEVGGTLPEPRGRLDGAPVLGYVVPTTLPPAAVGFAADDGIVALAVTAHPDFDDTPLWDESGDGDYANDGDRWHAHWVLVAPDERLAGDLAVVEVAAGADAAAVLPPTNPGLPLYLDSPGFPVQLDGSLLRVAVPAPQVDGETDFAFDAATVYLEVNTASPSRPLLGVYDLYDVLSDDLSLPYAVEPGDGAGG